MSHIETAAPPSSRRSVIASPSPRAAPVTTAPRPLKSNLFIRIFRYSEDNNAQKYQRTSEYSVLFFSSSPYVVLSEPTKYSYPAMSLMLSLHK